MNQAIQWKNPNAEGFKSLQILTTEERIGNLITSLQRAASSADQAKAAVSQLNDLWQQYQRELNGETLDSDSDSDDLPF